MLNIVAGLLNGAGAPASTTSYESIATAAGGSSSVTFSSIPSTYKHLQIRYIMRSAAVANTSAIFVRFNSDSASNYYAYHELFADGATAAAYAGGAGTSIQLDQFPANNKTANVYGAGVIDILDYLDTNKYKTTRNLAGFDANGSGAMVFASGLWRSTAAISSITLTENNSQNFATYSSFALYGIKG